MELMLLKNSVHNNRGKYLNIWLYVFQTIVKVLVSRDLITLDVYDCFSFWNMYGRENFI